MTSARTLAVVASAAALLLAACGGDDSDGTNLSADSGNTERTVEIEMVDNSFEPSTLDVSQGETVRFTFTNNGTVAHDAFIGNAAAQMDHEQEMREAEDDGMDDMGTEDDEDGMDGMGTEDDEDGMDGMGTEDDEDAITLEPGDTGELTYTFDEVGTLEIGCHEPGHYEAGMKVTVSIA